MCLQCVRNSSCLVGTGPAETTSHPAHDDGYLDNSHLDDELDADADEYDTIDSIQCE